MMVGKTFVTVLGLFCLSRVHGQCQLPTRCSGTICSYGYRQTDCGNCLCCPLPLCPTNCPKNQLLNVYSGTDGCKKCSCRVCDQTQCPEGCLFGDAITRDKDGCQKCSCKENLLCAQQKCPGKCQDGTIKDFVDGCLKCVCRCARSTCAGCSHGVQEYYSEDGCRRCKCKPQVCDTVGPCGKHCDIEYDDNGCEVCECDGHGPGKHRHKHRKRRQREHGRHGRHGARKHNHGPRMHGRKRRRPIIQKPLRLL